MTNPINYLFLGNICYVDPTVDRNNTLEDNIIINNTIYHKTLGYIYIPGLPETLSHEDIKNINKIRRKFKTHNDVFDINVQFKKLFVRLIEAVNPDEVLDFGSGYDPILNHCKDKKFNFHSFDIDCQDVSPADSSSMAFFKDNQFDLITSIFVFHFNITKKDIQELKRVLKKSGMIICNIYKRDKKSRDHLKQLITNEGFSVFSHEIEDAKGHHIWLIRHHDFAINKSCKIENFIKSQLLFGIKE